MSTGLWSFAGFHMLSTLALRAHTDTTARFGHVPHIFVVIRRHVTHLMTSEMCLVQAPFRRRDSFRVAMIKPEKRDVHLLVWEQHHVI